MRLSLGLLLVGCLSAVTFAGGVAYFVTRSTLPELAAISQETAKINAQAAQTEAQTRLVRAKIEARETQAQLAARQQAQDSRLYRSAAAVAESLKALWAVVLGGVVIAGASAVAWYRYRYVASVPFRAEGTETLIPAAKSVFLTEVALRVQEARHSAAILALEDERKQTYVRDALKMAHAVNGLAKTHRAEVAAAEPLDVTGHALPAFSGPVYYSQLTQDAAYETGLIAYGRAVDSGNLVQVSFKQAQSVVRLGRQGFGKSESCKPEILTALALKYEQGRAFRLHLIDAHAGLEGALGTDLAPVLPLFDTVLTGKQVTDGDALLSFLDRQIADAHARQERGLTDSDPTDCVWIDEYTETIASHANGKTIDARVRSLLNLRKARKFVSLAVYDSSKGEQSNKGISPQKLGCSVLAFNTSVEQAAAVVGWEAAKLAPGLKEGQALIRLPKSQGNDGEVSTCQCAMVTPQDWQRFARYLPTAAEREAAVEQATPSLKALREGADLSQNELAKRTGIAQARLSRAESQMVTLTEDEWARIHAALTPRENDKIVDLSKYRQA